MSLVRVQPWPPPWLGSSVGRARKRQKAHLVYIAGWSSRLARLAHYQKVSGSNPLPATT